MVWYNRGKHLQADPNAVGVVEGPYLLLLDVIKIALMQTTYSPNIDTHEQFDDISASEIVATGYTARGNGIQLTTKVVVRDDTNDRAEFNADFLSYTGIGNGTNDTFDQISVMRETDAGPTNANTELLATVVVASTTTNGGTITLVFDAQGLLQFS